MTHLTWIAPRTRVGCWPRMAVSKSPGSFLIPSTSCALDGTELVPSTRRAKVLERPASSKHAERHLRTGVRRPVHAAGPCRAPAPARRGALPPRRAGRGGALPARRSRWPAPGGRGTERTPRGLIREPFIVGRRLGHLSRARRLRFVRRLPRRHLGRWVRHAASHGLGGRIAVEIIKVTLGDVLVGLVLVVPLVTHELSMRACGS